MLGMAKGVVSTLLILRFLMAGQSLVGGKLWARFERDIRIQPGTPLTESIWVAGQMPVVVAPPSVSTVVPPYLRPHVLSHGLRGLVLS